MILELHILQNFAPSNLNRDDTGSPKDCEFGGYRRARISSQCLKHSMRDEFKKHDLIPAENQSERTKRLVEELSRRLGGGANAEQALEVARTAVTAALGLKLEKEDKTQYLLFLGEAEISGLASACRDHWDDLVAAASGKKADKALPAPIAKELKRTLDGGRAVDLALFGRMLADLPEHNRDAASQVAHAISTNRVHMQFDYFTAVDDLNPDDTAGAGMIGTVEFNSACFYRYLNLDLVQLWTNLQEDDALARTAVEAFVRAAIRAIPSGKQNSMAAQNPPSFVAAVLRDHGTWSLVNAFVEPAYPNGRDLIAESIVKLDRYWGELMVTYGGAEVRDVSCFQVGGPELTALNGALVPSQDDLISRVMAALAAGIGGLR